MPLSRFWVASAVAVACSLWSNIASANFTASPDPAQLGANVVVDGPGGTTASTSVTITHNGTTSETLQSLVKPVSTNCDPYTVTVMAPGLPWTTSTDGQTRTVDVVFDPVIRGLRTCTVSMRDAGNVEIGTFVLQGTGVAPELGVSQTNLNFGGFPVAGGNDAPINFNIQNNGDTGQPLTITSMVLGGMHPGDYSVSAPPGGPIAPGGTFQVTVTFNPTTSGTRDATLTIESDDPVDSNEVVTLTGVGQIPVISHTSPDPMNFTQLAGTQSAAQNIVLRNIGDTTLTVDSATISAGGMGWIEFTGTPQGTCNDVTGTCNYTPDQTIAPATNLSVGIRCQPPSGATGSVNATVTFASDSVGGDNQVTVNCTAQKPDIMVAPTSITFANTAVVGGTDTDTVTVTNIGDAQLTYNITITGANPGDFTYNNPQCTVGTPCTLAGGINANRVFTVTFNPSADGLRTATMHFNSDDQETPDVQVSLMGTGTGAEITRLSANPLDFGQVNVGSSATRTLSVRNDGTGDNLNITAVTLSLPATYSLAPGTVLPLVIPPGMTGNIDIVCAPLARGTFNGTATATNNSWNTPSLVTNVNCQGIDGDLRINGSDPFLLAFGDVAQGSVVNQTVTLRNFGELPVASITATVPPGQGYSVSGVPTMLAPDDGAAGGPDQAIVTVTFAPTMTEDGGPADVLFDGDTDDALLQLTGNGLSNGIDVDPGSLTFPDTRWDQFTVATFEAENTGEATLTISQAALSSGTDFAITQIRIDREGNGSFELTQAGVPPNIVLCGRGDTGGSCPGVTGGIAEFTVRFTPEDTLLGNKSDMLTILCSLPSPDNMRIVPLAGVSVSANLSVSPGMTIDFGGVDLDGPLPATQVLSLQNTAPSTTLDVTGHSAFAAPFGATGFAPETLDPGETNTTTVTYTPTVEQAAPGDVQVVTYNLAGLHPTVGPNAVMITLQGHGTDRHFVSNGPIVFPPTYRNPNPAPEADVTVMNTGGAPLDLQAVMLVGGPIFEIVSGGPQIVDPGSMATYRVRFTPTMAQMYDGIVEIMHDDNGVPTPPNSQVALSGLGLVPEFIFPPAPIEIGTAIVGDEIHRDDVIPLINISDQTTHPTTFTVAALTVTDASGTITVDDPAMRPIAPGATERFGATFTPTVAGPFTTTVDVFIGNDPVAVGSVTLTGHAVEVDVRGGGCSAGSGTGGATVLVVLAIALGLRRRRTGGAAPYAAVALVLLAPAVPRADVTVQSFHPMPSIEDDLFAVESATVGEANAWAAGIAVSYAREPLVSTVTNCGSECPDMVTVGQEASLVKQQTMVAVGGAYALANRFEIGLTIPLLMQSGDSAMIGATADGATLGDVAVHGKAQLAKFGRFALGAAAVLTAPTSKDGQFAGYDGPSGSISLLASQRARRFLVSVNVGFLGRKTEDLASVNQGSAVLFGAGAGYRVAHSVWIAAEGFGDYGIVEDAKPSFQALAGLRVRLGNSISVGLGGGMGIGEGLGVPKARGFLLVGLSPKMRPAEAMRPPPPPPDTRDSDGDGIVNADDTCPNEAEDKDVFEDSDGCPDPDNDGDKVNDGGDQCADEAEDLDGFKDDDGCPDKDNDGDGIEDPTDVCPNALEDMDSHADLDGCPDPDNDHDGVEDDKDKCKDTPETINGNNDDDGCPDKGDSLVLLAADRIELLEPIKFSGTGTKMTKKTLNLLAQVAATLRANPEIVRIRVTAHVHPRATKEKDQQLSDDRATVIKDWLVNWGISTDRVDAKGFGSSKPLVSASKKGAEDINDRIEFVIMEKSQ
jgi:outer membrane protein OmpA-like peptidoglycan-associated protein